MYEHVKHKTVLKTSLFFEGDGFAAYDSNGALVFRVDSYGPNAGCSSEFVLMDARGRCILIVRRKRPSLHHRWEAFSGERVRQKKPIFSVLKSSMFGRSRMFIEVYNKKIGNEWYEIEGSFRNRRCTIFDPKRESVAEIRCKVDAYTNVVLGKDIFQLSLKPGFDGAFAMGLVLILDQIHGTGYEHQDGDVENGDKLFGHY